MLEVMVFSVEAGEVGRQRVDKILSVLRGALPLEIVEIGIESRQAQETPSSENVAWAFVARSRISSIPGSTAWACWPVPTQFTSSDGMAVGGSAVRTASRTFMKAPL